MYPSNQLDVYALVNTAVLRGARTALLFAGCYLDCLCSSPPSPSPSSCTSVNSINARMTPGHVPLVPLSYVSHGCSCWLRVSLLRRQFATACALCPPVFCMCVLCVCVCVNSLYPYCSSKHRRAAFRACTLRAPPPLSCTQQAQEEQAAPRRARVSGKQRAAKRAVLQVRTGQESGKHLQRA